MVSFGNRTQRMELKKQKAAHQLENQSQLSAGAACLFIFSAALCIVNPALIPMTQPRFRLMHQHPHIT
jgi:hypothetical protein